MVRVRLGHTMAICLVLQHQVSPVSSVLLQYKPYTITVQV